MAGPIAIRTGGQSPRRKSKRRSSKWVWMALLASAAILIGEMIVLVYMYVEGSEDGHCLGHVLICLGAALVTLMAIHDILERRQRRRRKSGPRAGPSAAMG